MPHDYPASKQGPLGTGDRLCDLPFLDPKGAAFSLYDNHVFGWPKALVVVPDAARAEAELARFAALLRDFGQVETHVVAVARSAPEANAAVAERLQLPYPLLSDPDGLVHRLAGLEGEACCALMFDAVLRLERRVAGADGASLAEAALQHARARAAVYQPVIVGAQSPVLVLPNVLDRDHCRRLMDFWETGDKLQNTVASSDERTNRPNPKTKIRSDVIIPEDTVESQELVDAINRRLLPEVLKAFTVRISRLEHFRVGCYDADSGGHFAPHRDNTTPLTKHRRFALTLNLNSGQYEGGFLRLPEYGAQLYAPPSGGAVVFSCSLLHLASPVTKGRRFVVVGFLWGEEEQKLYEESHKGLTFEDTLVV